MQCCRFPRAEDCNWAIIRPLAWPSKPPDLLDRLQNPLRWYTYTKPEYNSQRPNKGSQMEKRHAFLQCSLAIIDR
uniref:Uncharacterized protein n=1 Tax=Rhizophora mucronata TaxID=61149 RepID=A0A2P2QZJ1_RHIMU